MEKLHAELFVHETCKTSDDSFRKKVFTTLLRWEQEKE